MQNDIHLPLALQNIAKLTAGGRQSREVVFPWPSVLLVAGGWWDVKGERGRCCMIGYDWNLGS